MVPVSLSVYYCCYLAAFVNFCFIYFIIIRIIYLCFNKLYTYFLMHLKSYICLNIADKCLLHSLLDLLLFIQQKCFLCLPINEIKVRHVIHIYIISISWNFASYINRTSSKVKGFWKTPFYPVHKAKQILKPSTWEDAIEQVPFVYIWAIMSCSYLLYGEALESIKLLYLKIVYDLRVCHGHLGKFKFSGKKKCKICVRSLTFIRKYIGSFYFT